jgi:NAD(P)-dependent dehydrogenase (short-subunit alcohol dehydrogenase family)
MNLIHARIPLIVNFSRGAGRSNKVDLELADKTAIVTGGSRGIGKAIARQLALEGVDVVIVARTRETLDEAAAELQRETGRRIIPIPANTGDDDSVKAMVQGAAEALDHLDILVNCAAQVAGTGPSQALADITHDNVWADMNVKVMGYLRCAQAVAPYMQQQGWGRIVNISGMAARRAVGAVSSMRNVSVVALTKNLAMELGPHGINVTVVHPGVTRTERTATVVATQAEHQGISEDEVERRMAEQNSVRKIIDAQDIAYVVAFLASPKSIAINGDLIAASGGHDEHIYY